MVEGESGPMRILMDEANFKCQRALYTITKKNYMKKKTPERWDQREEELGEVAGPPTPQEEANRLQEISLQQELIEAELHEGAMDLQDENPNFIGFQPTQEPARQNSLVTVPLEHPQEEASKSNELESDREERLKVTREFSDKALTRQAAKRTSKSSPTLELKELATQNAAYQKKLLEKQINLLNKEMSKMQKKCESMAEQLTNKEEQLTNKEQEISILMNEKEDI